jgi:hypothetical protein
VVRVLDLNCPLILLKDTMDGLTAFELIVTRLGLARFAKRAAEISLGHDSKHHPNTRRGRGQVFKTPTLVELLPIFTIGVLK